MITNMRPPLSEEKKLAAALLRASGESQLYVQRVCGISQSSVSNCVAWAKERGFLSYPKPFINKDRVPSELMVKASALIEFKDLQEAIERFVKNTCREGANPSVRIFSSGSRKATKTAWRRRLAQFGRACGPYVLSLLLKAKNAGISWGATTACVVSAIEEMGVTPSARITVVPLAGEPLGAPFNLASSSTLAARLQLRLGNNAPALSLAGVPALIPLAFKTSRDRRTINSLISLVRDYKTIFLGNDRQPPVADLIDCVLCSVGPAERVWGDDLVRSGPFDVHKLRELVHGDVCGVLLPCHDKGREIFSLSKRWTCVERRQLEACVRRGAFDSKNAPDRRARPGIILVAIGANKAECVLECLRQNLVNHLVIDDDLADALKKLLDCRLITPPIEGLPSTRAGHRRD
jgi:DNA-binding transcriptional regulator LsrR (DeoR family)